MTKENPVEIPKKEIIKVLQDLVRVESVNPPGLEKAMGDYIVNYMTQAGIPTETVYVQEGRFNVVSILKGRDSSDGIIFTGHMDVVPVSEDERERWNVGPFSGNIIGEYLYGRGSADMKGGLTCAMVAMKSLKEKNIVPEKDIALVATVDEENLMLGSRAMIGNPLIRHCKSVVVCEPTSLKVCTASRGRTYATIHITGKTGHGSRPVVGQNAIELSRFIMDRMACETFEEYASEKYGRSFWQPLSIHAGIQPCVIPDRCSMVVDARIVPGHMPGDVWQSMKNIFKEIKEEVPTFQAKIELIDEREPWETPDDCDLMIKTRKVYKEHFCDFETDVFTGTTDGTFLRRDGREAIIAGPGDLNNVHQENEKVELEELYQAFEIYMGFMI